MSWEPDEFDGTKMWQDIVEQGISSEIRKFNHRSLAILTSSYSSFSGREGRRHEIIVSEGPVACMHARIEVSMLKATAQVLRCQVSWRTKLLCNQLTARRIRPQIIEE